MLDSYITLKGIKVSNVTYDDIMTALPVIVKNKTPTHIITLNANMFYSAQRNSELKGLINTADIVTPDGAGVMWAARLFGHRFRERVTGFDLFKRFLMYANDNKLSVFLLGGRQAVNDRMAAVVKGTYRGIRLVGRHHGFFTEEREKEIVESIRKTRPDFLFVALGSFRQEIFIYNWREQFKVPVMIGVGGSFDVLTGRSVLAPRWVRRAGFEWLFRFLLNPLRLPRILKLPLFVIELLWYRIFKAKVL